MKCNHVVLRPAAAQPMSAHGRWRRAIRAPAMCECISEGGLGVDGFAPRVHMLGPRRVDVAPAGEAPPHRHQLTHTSRAQVHNVGEAHRRRDQFKPQERQYRASHAVRLPVATSDTAILLNAATHAVDKIWRTGFRYKKAGVELLELSPPGLVQGDLWTAPDSRRRKAIMASIDQLNADHGRGMVRFGASGVTQGWKLRCEQRSKRYTTEWDELLLAN